MNFVYSPLHARHDGGKELYRGEFVPTFETPARVGHILAALQAGGFEQAPPREYPESLLHRVHDADFVEFLRTAFARWHADGREGCMLPSGFPARGLRRDRKPAGISGSMGYYAFDASTPIMEGTWDAALAAAHTAMVSGVNHTA